MIKISENKTISIGKAMSSLGWVVSDNLEIEEVDVKKQILVLKKKVKKDDK